MSNTFANRQIAHPTLHHFGLTTPKLEAMVDGYAKVLGMAPKHVYSTPAGSQTQRGLRAARVTNDRAKHRIAIMALPGQGSCTGVDCMTAG
jgi:catechol 2,3-dioxygenase-like lactoylglutathione lyase family enzyme